ncbi:uncharacterized protein BP5553_06825 [Venustampulla echinocandica]|uniref:Uncharacterized protein n=1 Tax=Venustampulla echinocandica TaxID=2656787 RepID=A0A370TL13_9HELO|nr:uncharacterized protein BP5553_06825 [Venustampulla echinocandica]RDL36213.1 hypothetical protein BP5553_06825 [Venustampulla echinocandica]
MEEKELLVREEQERVTYKEEDNAAMEEETPATEGKERLVKNITKQWEERLGQKMPKEKTQDQRRPKIVGKGVQRGIGAAKRNWPLTQFELETLRDAEPQELIQGPSHQTAVENERRTMADQEEVENPIHNAQPSADYSATDNSNSTPASGKIPEHVTNSEELIKAVELQATRPSRDQKPDPAMVWIKFKICDRSSWRVVQDLEVDPSDPSEVKRIAMKYYVTADGTNNILLIPERDIDTDNLPSSVPEKGFDLQTNSEADPSTPENTEEDGEETVRKGVARRDSSCSNTHGNFVAPADTCLQDYYANAAPPFRVCAVVGSWCFYKMYKKQERLIAMKEERLEDLEPAAKVVEETKDGRLAIGERKKLSRGGSEIEPAKHPRIS